jgi:hypothetical protein
VGLSLLGQLGGRGKWGNFIAQWVPTILIMGVYNKLVKLEGHDQRDRGRGSARSAGISNRSPGEEQAQRENLPPRGAARNMAT